MGWYPARRAYFRVLDANEEIVQGDSLWGVPSPRAVHPALADSFLRPGPLPTAEDLRRVLGDAGLADVLRRLYAPWRD